MKTLGLFAFGEMGETGLRSLLPNLKIKWVALPFPSEQTITEARTQELAKKNKLLIFNIRSFTELKKIFNTKQDGIVICSFNRILKKELLSKTKFINVHLGDLPKYRGRANVNWAIINGKKDITVTIHKVIPELDAGNIYVKRKILIKETDSVKDVYEKINKYLEHNLSVIVKKILEGDEGKKQSGSPSYCCTRLPGDGLIDWSKKSFEIFNLIRGITKPYPGAFSYLDGEKLIIWEAELGRKRKVYEGRIPGRIGSLLPGYGVEVLTGDSSIIIKSVNYRGKDMNASECLSSVKKTLGINFVELFEQFNKLKK